MMLNSHPTRKLNSGIILLLTLWAVLYLWGLGTPDVDYSIEAFRMVMARNMIETGDWLVPMFRDEAYLLKPPLMNWLIAIFSIPFGDVTEWSGRLPSALSVLALSFLILLWGKRNSFGKAAIYAAVLFLILPLVFEKGTRAEIDMNFTLWVTCSLMCLFEGIRLQYEGRCGRKWTLFAYGFLTLALLSKGPPAMIFFFGTWLVFQSKVRWKSFQLSDHLLGFGIVILGFSLWLIPALSRVGVLETWTTFRIEVLDRLTEAEGVNRAPFYFYILSLPGGAIFAAIFMPWLRVPHDDQRKIQAFWFLVFWVLSAIILFTFVAGKESRYLLPVYPAVALLGGLAVERFLTQSITHKSAKILMMMLIVITLIGGIGLWIGQFYLTHKHFPYAPLWTLLGCGGAVLAGVFYYYFKASARALTAILLLFFAAKGFYLTARVPDRNERKSSRVICEKIRLLVPQPEKIYISGLEYPQLVYYLKSPIGFTESLTDFAQEEFTLPQCHLFVDEKECTEENMTTIGKRYNVVKSVNLETPKRNYRLLHLEKKH